MTRVTHSEIEHLAKHPYSKRHDCSFTLQCLIGRVRESRKKSCARENFFAVSLCACTDMKKIVYSYTYFGDCVCMCV